MMSDRPNEIRRIADHLGIPLSETALRQIDAKTNIERSKELCTALPQRPSNQVLRVANHLVDPVTHLHQNHINGGTTGRWKFELSIDQAMYMTEYFAPWLIKLGYETDASIEAFLKRVSFQTNPAAPLAADPFPQTDGYAMARR